jgi:hypothetical protein
MTKKQKIRAIGTYDEMSEKLRGELSDLGVFGSTWVWDYKALNKLSDHDLDIVLIKIMKDQKAWAVPAAWFGEEMP